MRSKSSTTSRELSIQGKKETLDLASGYPKFNCEERWRLIVEQTLLHFNSTSDYRFLEPSNARNNIAQGLFSLAGGHGKFPGSALLAPTASFALQRVLVAISEPNKPFLVCSPTLDVLRILAEEATGIAPVMCQTVTDVMRRLDLTNGDSFSGVLFAFPGNPHSDTWSLEDFISIAKVCASMEIPIIHDGCFAPIARNREDYRPLDHLDRSKIKWVEILDTGKTFDFAHEKLCLVLADDWSHSRIKSSLELVLFSLPYRSLYFWSHFLKSKEARDYVINCRRLLRENQGDIVNFLCQQGFTARESDALSFIVVQETDTNKPLLRIQQILDCANIGYVNLQDFGDGEQNSGVRLCVARDKCYLAEAIKRIQAAIVVAGVSK